MDIVQKGKTQSRGKSWEYPRNYSTYHGVSLEKIKVTFCLGFACKMGQQKDA